MSKSPADPTVSASYVFSDALQFLEPVGLPAFTDGRHG
eukprot:CAMPEP_0117684828 /NCGR_PEP_ID=MMETSP0804-20121206/21353_1 /TAXON_ID=1074897 /ORGANISM="Tetraselmis astigmatica, Strain CCMP880" /LENGTH=37 /DNA_ID= /DNA_START= /DNA_END= /DNA_ORIENTATION=